MLTYSINILLMLLYLWGKNPEDTSVNFMNAVSMTNDGKGNIYVLDNEANEVIKLSNNLALIKKIGRKGWNNGEFDSPTYIDGSSGLDIFVCDGKNFRIQRFDLNLSYVASLITNTETFDENLKFNNPYSCVIINSRDLYVIDGDNFRIVKYQDGTKPILSFAGFQDVKGSLSSPGKIQKDASNSIYVLDKVKNSLLQYDVFGNFMKSIKYDTLISFSINRDNIFLLTTNLDIIRYDINKQAFAEKIKAFIDLKTENIRDFLVYDSEKFLILEKNKISFYKF
jgi:hypothetical protein